ncbi:uncharacterized protein LOC143210549 [Lasioglossum baleicum]|uniref:uncharacterized protein LOC143210549 n=1 Tax=Lasioglossum baleicum TaxID=434251 RepID=UPI003FCE5E89
MASFGPRFQISSLILPKDSSSNLLFRRSSQNSMILTGNVRSFWFKSKRKPAEVGTGNCGEPASEKIEALEPCKGCPSKCIQPEPKRKFFWFRKSPPAEKPSNCVKKKPSEVKLTMWEEIFGPDPKRSWPDPCTCRMANRQRKKQRREDPRLLDPRYEETEGDVFLYTQLVKQCRKCCLEPQPTSPPAFQLPKAVMYRMIGEGCNKKPFEELTGDQEMENKVRKMPEYRIPYEELRPPEKRRKTFSCRAGIRPEYVQKPTNEELNFIKAFPKVPQVHSQPCLRKMEDTLPENRVQNEDSLSKTKCAGLENGTDKRCRFEQLKMLMEQKNYNSSRI